MSKYINLYLDESGNLQSHYFVVAGFYLISNNEKTQNKRIWGIKSNIKKTEKSIMEYRMNHESKMTQFIDPNYPNDEFRIKEVKWTSLSTDNKMFLAKQIKSYGQTNISMVSDLRKWHRKNKNPKLNLDFIYNYMVHRMLEEIFNREEIKKEEEVILNIHIDQRKDIPKDDSGRAPAVGLEKYLNDSFVRNSGYCNLNIKTFQHSSKANELIRYADYYSGITASMLRFIKHTRVFSWDKDIDKIFTKIHSRIKCQCYATHSGKSRVISELCKKCASTKPAI